jgi:hypothetical protein
MRSRPSDRFYGLLGRVIARVVRGYLRHELARSRRKLVLAGVAGVAGVAVGVGVAAVARRGRAGGGGRSRGRPG